MKTLIDQFVDDVCAGKDNETPHSYRSKLARLSKWVHAQQIKLSDLTMDDVHKFRKALLEQRMVRRGTKLVPGRLSPFTICTVMRTVKHFLKWLFNKGLIFFDPSPFKIKPPPPPDPKPITAQNAMALLHAAARQGKPWERARNLAMLYVLQDTAGRISAILEADIDNLDLLAGKLFVREKGDKPHVLYINDPTIQAITLWLEFRPTLEPIDNALFISQRGRALTRSGFYSVMIRLVNAAGLRGKGRTNPHGYRHAWARDALAEGNDLTRVSQTLAHSTVRVTGDYYARWADKELKAAHKRYSPGAKLPLIKPKED